MPNVVCCVTWLVAMLMGTAASTDYRRAILVAMCAVILYGVAFLVKLRRRDVGFISELGAVSLLVLHVDMFGRWLYMVMNR